MKKGIVLGLALSLMIAAAACAAKGVGEIAPDFTLNDIDGNEVNLYEILSSKLVLLDFWATWCPKCKGEIPHVQEFYEKYKEKVVVIGIDYNEPRKTVSDFVKKNSITYTVVIDSGEVTGEYKIVTIPTIILIDKDKKVLYSGKSVKEAEQYLK